MILTSKMVPVFIYTVVGVVSVVVCVCLLSLDGPSRVEGELETWKGQRCNVNLD